VGIVTRVELTSSDPVRRAHFSEQPRGFDPDEVHAFLAELADAVDRLLDDARASDTEVVPGEGAVGRALVLAQRMADQVAAEAEDAARLVREHAQEDAEQIRRAAVTESESAVQDLERQRHALEQQLGDLERWVAQRRDSLRQLLSEGLRGVDAWLDSAPSPRAHTGDRA